ncbi:MAG: NOL1/NOP2/sun family putative RNA methylase [Proteobacteria bacterium]|nr:NOL1/NOP2/sun family putative RNA methylase [Pseudomonadota bacterium]
MEFKKEQPFQDYEPFIPDVDAFYDSLHRPLVRCLRVNTLRITPSELTQRLEEQGCRVKPTFLADYLLEHDGLERPGSKLEATLGYFISQALSSAVAVIALDPKPTEFVCDLCAAPGSKTTHAAQLMDNSGLIVANDSKEKRIRALEHNIKRLGITNVVTTVFPGQNFPQRWRFERVLADVPCSGEGTFRFPPSTKKTARRPAQRFLPEIQQSLIIRAFDLLIDGGILLYSTCAYNPDENEGVIQYLLEKRLAEILPISLSVPHSPGLLRWKDKKYDRQMGKCWRIYPHQLNSVGFFLAKIRRRSSSN